MYGREASLSGSDYADLQIAQMNNETDSEIERLKFLAGLLED
jgi:hypothetical protein